MAYVTFVAILASTFVAMTATPAVSQTADFLVGVLTDGDDADLGDGLCSTAGGDCTLRAAVQQANALPGAQTVSLSAATDPYIVNDTIEITSSITIDGQPDETGALPIIDGDGSTQIFYISSDDDGPVDVSIDDLVLQNGDAYSGGAIEKVSDGELALTNVTLDNNDANQGGAIAIGAGDVTLTNSTLTDNAANYAGGAIYNDADNTIMTLTNTDVTDNTSANGSSGYGGGIASWGDALNLVVSGGEISDNTGGGIWIDSYGGLVDLSGVTLDNNASNSYGGAVYYDADLANFTLRDGSTVTNNDGSYYGGGLYLYNEGGVSKIQDSTVSDNGDNSSVDYGGGIYQACCGDLQISGSTLNGNTADDYLASTTSGYGYGGAVYYECCGAVTVANSTISGNRAGDYGGYGGGIFHSCCGPLTVTGTTFASNHAGGNSGWGEGGAIYKDGYGDLSMTGGSVTGNTAHGYGGGLVNYYGNLEITDVLVTHNAAVEEGGGALAHYCCGNLEVTGSTVTNNLAGADGGGLADYCCGDVIVADSNISNNAAGLRYSWGEGGGVYFACCGNILVSDSTVDNNSAAYGGGIITDCCGNVEVSGSSVSDNTAKYWGGGILSWCCGDVRLSDTDVSRNTAEQENGGGVVNWCCGAIAASNSTINDNTAGEDGGGAWFECCGTVEFTNGSTLNGNSAGGDGGGAWFGCCGVTRLIDSAANGNVADDKGGAFFQSWFDGDESLSVVEITRSQVKNNGFFDEPDPNEATVIDPVTTDDGGAIYTEYVNLNVTDSQISGNFASYDGGGIFNHGTATITNSTLSDNGRKFDELGGSYTTEDGGALFHDEGDVTIHNSRISGNYASDEGGGIWNTDLLRLFGSSVTGNGLAHPDDPEGDATERGGGIFSDDNDTDLVDTTVANNVASEAGGGIYNTDDEGSSALSLKRSTVWGNSIEFDEGDIALESHDDGNGGGIWNSSDVVATNSTISHNSSDNDGGGIYNEGDVWLRSTTIARNHADDDGGGLYDNSGDTITMENTLLAGNTAAPESGGNCDGATPVSTGYNLDDDGSCGLSNTGDLSEVSAGLGVLATNGGATMTHLPLAGSSAVDAGTCNFEQDQRGLARPFGAGCDIGATEATDADADGVDDGIGDNAMASFVDDNGTVTTGSSASNTNVTSTSVTSPNSGLVSISETTTTESAPSGWSFFGEQVNITAPDASSPAEPLVITFRVDASVVPSGTNINGVEISRNGSLVPDGCPDLATASESDYPCVVSRTVEDDGDFTFVVRTMQASAWNFAYVPPPPPSATTGGGGLSIAPAMTIDDVTVDEGDSELTDAVFTVKLTRPSDTTIMVEFTTADGTAGSTDYHSRDGTLTFAPGEMTKTISVPVVGDTEIEDAESFFLDLGSISGATLEDGQGVATIVDDDAEIEPPVTGCNPEEGDICGTDDNDVLMVDASADADGDGVVELHLGAGDDSVCVDSTAGLLVRVFGGDGNDVVKVAVCEGSTPGDGAAPQVEFFGGPGNDTFTGGAADDTFFGGLGNDRASGRGGNDTLKGGGGADVLIGHAGNDALVGGAGDDELFGGTGGDALKGGGGADFLSGGSGTDTCRGRAAAGDTKARCE